MPKIAAVSRQKLGKSRQCRGEICKNRGNVAAKFGKNRDFVAVKIIYLQDVFSANDCVDAFWGQHLILYHKLQGEHVRGETKNLS